MASNQQKIILSSFSTVTPGYITLLSNRMSALAPLAMSQTKDELLKHLNMAPETYTLMAKETDKVYKWLTSEKRHLKKNCKRKPPYDWSDIVEKSKDEAMELIARSGDAHTSYYWNLAVPTNDCPNWIARWFLYHKFRYRDGRNRNPVKSEDGKHTYRSSSGSHKSSGKHSYHSPNSVAEGSDVNSDYASYYQTTGMMSASSSVPATANYAVYDTAQTYQISNQARYTPEQDNDRESKPYYDPVRDVQRL